MWNLLPAILVGNFVPVSRGEWGKRRGLPKVRQKNALALLIRLYGVRSRRRAINLHFGNPCHGPVSCSKRLPHSSCVRLQRMVMFMNLAIRIQFDFLQGGPRGNSPGASLKWSFVWRSCPGKIKYFRLSDPPGDRHFSDAERRLRLIFQVVGIKKSRVAEGEGRKWLLLLSH